MLRRGGPHQKGLVTPEADGDGVAFADGGEWLWAAFWAWSSACFMSAVYLP